jgi:hypothetical protein
MRHPNGAVAVAFGELDDEAGRVGAAEGLGEAFGCGGSVVAEGGAEEVEELGGGAGPFAAVEQEGGEGAEERVGLGGLAGGEEVGFGDAEGRGGGDGPGGGIGVERGFGEADLRRPPERGGDGVGEDAEDGGSFGLQLESDFGFSAARFRRDGREVSDEGAGG